MSYVIAIASRYSGLAIQFEDNCGLSPIIFSDNRGYVKPVMARHLALLTAPAAAFAESKFLSLLGSMEQ